jgi:antitoxin MazE
MILDIIKIGNSQGIRIPKNILKECGIQDKIDLEIKGHNILIKPLKTREGWEESFKEMRENNDDSLLISDDLDLEIGDDWEW